jgi:pimeloyl-ACP methyl ester carboxylesterase
MVDHLLGIAPEQFALAGHSMGGWVAQAAAFQAPGRVKKLALLNTWASSPPAIQALQHQLVAALQAGLLEEILEQYFPRIVHPSHLHDQKLLGNILTMAAHFSPQMLIDQLQAMLADPSTLPFLSKIQAPTLVIYSENDSLFPGEEKTLSARIPHAELALLPETGHASLMERPAQVTSLLRTFLSKNL